MSQDNPKYKRLEALLSDAKQVKPEPDHAPGDQDAETLKVQLPQPDAKPAGQEAETLKAQIAKADAQAEQRSVTAEKKSAATLPQVVTQPMGPKPAEESQSGAKEKGIRPAEDAADRSRNAFMVSALIALAHFVAGIYYIYLVEVLNDARYSSMVTITFVLVALTGIGTLLCRRGLSTPGIILVLGSLSAAYPLLATQVEGLGLVIGFALMVGGPLIASYTLPKKPMWGISIVAVIAGLGTILLDIFGSLARPALPGIFVQLLALSVLGVTGYFFFLRVRDYSLRTKLILAFSFTAIMIVSVTALIFYSNLKNQILQEFRSVAAASVGIAALQQNGDEFARISSANDPLYEKFNVQNLKIRRSYPQFIYVYTLSKDDEGLYFIVDASEPGEENMAAFGDRYDDPSITLASNYDTMTGAIADPNVYTDQYGSFLSAYAPIFSSDGKRVGVIGIDIDAATIVQKQNQLLILTLTIVFFAGLLSIALGYFFGNLLAKPIGNLIDDTHKFASGDFSFRTNILTNDEIGNLGRSFNLMADEIQRFVTGLEKRVSDRTHDLELASEVGRVVTQKVSDLDDLMTTAAEMIRARFGLYYTQVYLTDPAGRLLLLKAGTGEVGKTLLKRSHRLTIDYSSLNGRAVLDRKPVIVADTLKNPNFKPNPLLPKTRSEMAVPLISGENILGVLDMQSEQAGSMNEDNLAAFEALAGQLAIAIQNAGLFAETEQARAEIEARAQRLTRSGWTDYMDAIHKPEQTSYVFAENQIKTLQGEEMPPVDHPKAFSLPLEITGEPIGAFNVELENEAWTREKKELVQTVARQVAQQIENLRLLETAERYRKEAEQITRRLTHEGWEEYTETLEGGSLGFSYDLGEVVSFKGDDHQDASKALAIPLSVREEAIGQLTVDKNVSNAEAHEIIQAVASQLSSHIENLRLSEQNERRAAELEQAVNRLRELDRLKSSFLANMSHELRTPLNSILGFADVMLEELDGPLTANMQNDLGLIQKNGQHLLHLINDVLDMAKIEAGRMNLNIEIVRVHEILDEATSITSALASEKNLSLVIEPDSDRDVEITADRTRLRQVMINLVNNSIKFTDKGKISVSASCSNEHVLIRVKDNGIGISAEKLEDVFTEFAQVDTSSTRKAGGTGLGLPISRRLIEMHGGRLWAESSGVQGEGSVFYVELPLEARLTEPVEKLEK